MKRWLPLLVVALAILIGGGLRAWIQRRRTGSWGVVVFQDRRPIQLIRDFALVMVGVSIALQAGFVASRPQTDVISTGPPWPLGGAVASAGLLVMFVAQLQLGVAWRIGIDWAARPGLISHGLYRWSRNPIYVGLLTVLVGYALLIPTTISWAALLAAAVVIRSQVLDEERYLLSAYGSAFRAYAQRVGRFVPWLGRLSATSYGGDA